MELNKRVLSEEERLMIKSGLKSVQIAEKMAPIIISMGKQIKANGYKPEEVDKLIECINMMIERIYGDETSLSGLFVQVVDALADSIEAENLYKTMAYNVAQHPEKADAIIKVFEKMAEGK